MVQQNCGKGYERNISALEVGLGLNASVVYIQKSFMENRNISHAEFNLYWPFGTENRKDIRVLMAVKKDILSKIVIKNRTNLVDHPYCIVLDVREFHQKSGKFLKTTRIVNLYDNKIGQRQR